MKLPVNEEKYKKMYVEFIEKKHTAVLSFIDEEGKPFSSTAPFVKKDDKLYIYISEVADHYRLANNNEVIDVLLLGDESETKNPFATERVRISCKPTLVNDDGHEEVFELFNELCSKKMIDIFRGLDFSLFELSPIQGRYVVGFGLAFDVTIDGSTFSHVVVDKENKASMKS